MKIKLLILIPTGTLFVIDVSVIRLRSKADKLAWKASCASICLSSALYLQPATLKRRISQLNITDDSIQD